MIGATIDANAEDGVVADNADEAVEHADTDADDGCDCDDDGGDDWW